MDYLRIRVADLQAELVGKPVVVEAQIVGEQAQKALPSRLGIKCARCGAKEELDLLDHKEIMLARILGKNREVERLTRAVCGLGQSQCDDGKPHAVQVEILKFCDYAILYARDLLERIERFDHRKYVPRCVHLVGQRPPETKEARFYGKVVLDDRTDNIMILADRAEPLETEFTNFKASPEDHEAWKCYFSNNPEIHHQIAPNIVGKPRELAKRWVSLTLHSPNRIPDIHGRIIRGGLHGVFIGDTKTAKSETARDPTNEGTFAHPLGEYVDAGTGGRTGFLYTIDPDRRILIWGALPLNDGGFVVLDNFQQVNPQELGEYREVLETQRVRVRKSVMADAWARTRQIVCLNPNKNSIGQYLFPCEAILDSRPFALTPDITRWDFFIPFSAEDVSGEQIANREPKAKPIPEEVFYRHVLFAWSRRPEQICYTEDAKGEIRRHAKRLIKRYSIASLPLVHNGVLEVLCRISVARAVERHSVDETLGRVVVEAEHVRSAVKDYEQLLKALRLRDYKLAEEGKLELPESEFGQLIKELGENELRILDAIKREPKSSPVLAQELGISVRTVKRFYERLTTLGLIKPIPGKGVALTVRGVKLVRRLLLSSGDMVPKSGTKSSGQQKLVSKNGTMSPTAILKEKVGDRGSTHPTVRVESECGLCGSKSGLEFVGGGLGWVCRACREGRTQEFTDSRRLG